MGASSYTSYSGKGSTRRPSVKDSGYDKKRANELNIRDASKRESKEKSIPEISEIFESFTKLEKQKQKVTDAYKDYRAEQVKLEQMRETLSESIKKLDKGKRESFERLLNEVDPIGGNLDEINER